MNIDLLLDTMSDCQTHKGMADLQHRKRKRDSLQDSTHNHEELDPQNSSTELNVPSALSCALPDSTVTQRDKHGETENSDVLKESQPVQARKNLSCIREQSRGNRQRSEWRSMCRSRLSQHIRETLGIQVKPSEVRLINGGENMPYAWEIDDPWLKPVFEKHMSKHSVGAYMTLCRDVGRSFRAIHPGDAIKVVESTPRLPVYSATSYPERPGCDLQEGSLEPTVTEQLLALRADNIRLFERLEQAKSRARKQTWADTDAQIEMLKSIIQDAQTMICTHQRLLPCKLDSQQSKEG